MKKYLYLIALVMTFGMISCSDDECTHGTIPPPPPTVETYFPMASDETSAMWYLESENEEITYDGSGTFYDRYSNLERSGETEGRWEYDDQNKKLTYRYSFIGQNVQDNWTVKNIKEFEATISGQAAAALKLEKIVEKYKLGTGGTTKLQFATMHPDYVVNTYSSTNDRIASVTSDGTVTAAGEKGTAYIKMITNNGNVWAKITVGDDRKDLWCDMEPIIGMSYEQVTNHFKQFGQPQMIDGYKDFFAYALSVHDYIDNIGIILDLVEDEVVQLQIVIKDGVPDSEINSYLKSRYYKQSSMSNMYTTLPAQDDSKMVVVYYPEYRTVTFYDPIFSLAPLRNYTRQFGKTKSQVQDMMKSIDFKFLFTDYSYSANGADYFQSSGQDIDENVNMLAYVYNPSDIVSEIWAYKSNSVTYSTLNNYFKKYYRYASSESSTKKSIYYNKEKTCRITVDMDYEAVIYTDLTSEPIVPPTPSVSWPNYEDALYAKRSSVKNMHGDPYQEDENTLYYAYPTDGVDILAFTFSTNVDKCRTITMMLGTLFETEDVVSYLSTKFTVFENGTEPDGSQYAWINADTVADATIGIIYTPANRTIQYLGLALSSGVKAKVQAMKDAIQNHK